MFGVLDEARIWNHARSAEQIRTGKDQEIQTASGLIGRWGLPWWIFAVIVGRELFMTVFRQLAARRGVQALARPREVLAPDRVGEPLEPVGQANHEIDSPGDNCELKGG